jgi:hypothetical protein
MRRVFFSFHFQRDAFLVGQVRNSWIGNSSFEGQPYLDKAKWETIERQGDSAIKNWIDTQMRGTSVTVVLIGAQTLQRRWVKYEIAETLKRGGRLLGVTLTGMTNIDQNIELKSCPLTGTPFETKMLGNSYPVYNWVTQNGRKNLGTWIQQAAARAGR